MTYYPSELYGTLLLSLVQLTVSLEVEQTGRFSSTLLSDAHYPECFLLQNTWFNNDPIRKHAEQRASKNKDC